MRNERFGISRIKISYFSFFSLLIFSDWAIFTETLLVTTRVTLRAHQYFKTLCLDYDSNRKMCVSVQNGGHVLDNYFQN